MRQIKKFVTSISLVAITFSHAVFSQNNEDISESLAHAIRAKTQLENIGYSATISSLQNNPTGWPALLLKSEKYQDRIYAVEIETDKEGADPLFIAYAMGADSRCSLPDTILDKIITVSSQRIQTNYVCLNKQRGKGFTEIYEIKTENGKAFVEDKLLNNRFIVINLDGKELPFDLEGFSNKWIDLDEEAL